MRLTGRRDSPGASEPPTPNPRAVDRDLHGRRVFEKTVPAGRRGVRPIGLGLIALGILVLADLGRAALDSGPYGEGRARTAGWVALLHPPELLILDQATPAPVSKRVPSRPTWSGHHHGPPGILPTRIGSPRTGLTYGRAGSHRRRPEHRRSRLSCHQSAGVHMRTGTSQRPGRCPRCCTSRALSGRSALVLGAAGSACSMPNAPPAGRIDMAS
jgi:hypothetical protein